MYEVWLCHRKMPPKSVNRMTNSVDCSGSKLFAKTCLSGKFDPLRYFKVCPFNQQTNKKF